MTELKVGVLSIAIVFAIVFMSFKITQNQSGFGDYIGYKTILDDASGIFPKTPIKVAGIIAGRIKQIELSGNKALVTFEVLEKIKVTQGSILKIKSVGFLGDKFLEIEINTKETKLLSAESMLKVDTKGGMDGIMSNSSKLLEDLTILVTSIKESLVPVKGEAPLTIMIRDMQGILSDLKVISAESRDLVVDNKDSINSIVKNMRNAMEDLAFQMDASENESVMAQFGPIMGDIKSMTADMQILMSDVRSGKGTIGKFLVEDEIADQVQQTMASVQKLVGKVDAVRTDIEVFTGYDSKADVTSEFGMRIITSPERFYDVGVISSDIGPKTTTYTETTTDGIKSVEDKTRYNKDSFLFTATMGRHLGSWSVRGGLIESSAGAGVDYSYIPWGWRTSLDLFDARDDIGMNIRVSTEFRMWNVFYTRIRANDLAVHANQSFSFSLGLRFTDDDLKSLVGLML